MHPARFHIQPAASAVYLVFHVFHEGQGNFRERPANLRDIPMRDTVSEQTLPA
mgnify:CR=1 FL=1